MLNKYTILSCIVMCYKLETKVLLPLSRNYSTITRDSRYAFAKISLRLSSKLTIAQQNRVKLPAHKSPCHIIEGKVATDVTD